MIGPAPDTITWDTAYRSFLGEQELWGKTSGRLCAHYVLSFHKDEQITPQEVLEFANELAGEIFDGHQVIIGIHQDKDHLHAHMLVNAVSYIDGHKLHTTAKDLQRMKDITNQMCRDRGLSIAEKGRHFDGREIEAGDSIAWTKDKYHLLENDGKKSYLVDCAIAVTDAMERSASEDEFVREMGERGWTVNWSDKRKNITFENAEGKKVRNSNLSRTFSIDLSKEALEHEFVRTKERRAKEK